MSKEVLKGFTSREREVLEASVAAVRRVLDPDKILLFGSRAKGDATKGSDFDFAVDMKRPDTMKSFELEEELEKISGLYSVDVVFLKSVSAGFKNIVLKTGKVIYERGA